MLSKYTPMQNVHALSTIHVALDSLSMFMVMTDTHCIQLIVDGMYLKCV